MNTTKKANYLMQALQKVEYSDTDVANNTTYALMGVVQAVKGDVNLLDTVESVIQSGVNETNTIMETTTDLTTLRQADNLKAHYQS